MVRKKSKLGTGNFRKFILPSFPFRRHSVLQSLKSGSFLRKTLKKSSFWRHQKQREMTEKDPRWQSSRWKLHTPPPWTKQELQPENIEQSTWIITWKSAERKSITKDLQRKPQRDYRKGGYLSCKLPQPWKEWGLSPSSPPQPRAPEPGKGAHITSGYENQQGSCLLKKGESLLEN